MTSSFGIAKAFASWHAGGILLVMGVLSVYLVAIVILRAQFFRRIKADSQKMLEEAHEAFSSGDQKTVKRFTSHLVTDPPVKILIGTALNNLELTAGEMRELLTVTRIRQRERITGGLSVFGTLSTVAPFIGLLGTVMGIVESFEALAESGAAGPNVVAGGVAAALWATAAGLVVAIPAVVAYNVFKGKAKRIMTDLEVVSQELVLLLKSEHAQKTALKKAS
jgi:biopolymer transport protein ExbB/TolQ